MQVGEGGGGKASSWPILPYELRLDDKDGCTPLKLKLLHLGGNLSGVRGGVVYEEVLLSAFFRPAKWCVTRNKI